MEGAPLLGRLGPHTLPTGGKRIRDDGGPVPTTLAQVQGGMQAARAQGEGLSGVGF